MEAGNLKMRNATCHRARSKMVTLRPINFSQAISVCDHPPVYDIMLSVAVTQSEIWGRGIEPKFKGFVNT